VLEIELQKKESGLFLSAHIDILLIFLSRQINLHIFQTVFVYIHNLYCTAMFAGITLLFAIESSTLWYIVAIHLSWWHKYLCKQWYCPKRTNFLLFFSLVNIFCPYLAPNLLLNILNNSPRTHKTPHNTVAKNASYLYIKITLMSNGLIFFFIFFTVLSGLKGQCHEIFDFWFFTWISFPQAPEYIPSRPFRIFSKIRGDIRGSRCTIGVADTGGKWKKYSSRKILIMLFGHLWVVELTEI
jgi:hypothetical protein